MVTKLCYEIIPGSRMGCMLTKLTIYPYSCKPEAVLLAQKLNRRNSFYTDVQVFDT